MYFRSILSILELLF